MKYIEVNDIVTVNFNNAQFTLCHEAIVRYVPNSNNEAWIFEDCRNKEIHYVSEPCTITLIKKSTNSSVEPGWSC